MCVGASVIYSYLVFIISTNYQCQELHSINFLGLALPRPIAGATSLIIDKDAFVIGEHYGSSYGHSVIKYTPSGQWVEEEIRKLNVGRAYFSALVINERGLGECKGKLL